MSYQAAAAVTAHSKHSGSELLCLLMMANHAHPDGTHIFPSVRTLARECRMSDRGIQYIVAKLLQSGELEKTGTTACGTKIYRITLPMPEAPQYLHEEGVQSLHRGVNKLLHRGGAVAIAPKRSVERSENKERRGVQSTTPEELTPEVIRIRFSKRTWDGRYVDGHGQFFEPDEDLKGLLDKAYLEAATGTEERP